MLKEAEMGEFKIGLYILSWLGVLTCFAGIITNLDNIKSTILFLGAAIYLFYKIYNSRLDAIKKREDIRDARQLKEMNKKLKDAQKNNDVVDDFTN
jgi:hypothetical protein